MRMRAMQYSILPCQTESLGATTLRYPWLDTWRQYEDRFVRETVDDLCRGIPLAHPDHALEQAHLGRDALSLDEFFQDYRPVAAKLTWTPTGLLQLAEAAEDYTHDDGVWKDHAKDLDRPAQEAIEGLQRRIDQLEREVAVQHGLAPARQVLESVRNRFSELHVASSAATGWESRHGDELKEAAQQLRRLAGLRSSLSGWMVRLNPNWWLSASQRSAIQRRILPRIEDAALLRHERELSKRKLKVVEAVLGKSGCPGIIDVAVATLAQMESFFDQLPDHMTDLPATPPRMEPHQIKLVHNLDTVIDSPSRRTLGDLYDQIVRHAGYSPKALAKKIVHRGLLIGGRRYHPAEWTKLPLSRVRHALRAAVRRYLGSNDLQAPLDMNEPKTALDHVANIHLLHPALENLLAGVLASWAKQSRPYAEFGKLDNVEQKRHAFLFCYPPHRQQWQELLYTHVKLVNADSDADAFATRHPNVAIICQYDLARPLGGLRSLPSWVHQGNLLRKDGRIPPIHDRSAYSEILRLEERPDDFADSKEMLTAGLKAKAIVELKGTARYTLAKLDEQVETLFAPEIWVPEEVSDELILGRLKDPAVVRFLEIAFPAIEDLGTLARQMARQMDARMVADQLAQLGVLKQGVKGRYLLQYQPATGDRFPVEFFRRKPGPLMGLTRDDFLAALNRIDELYNIVFRQLSDALDDERISPADVPTFVREFHEKL